jgi:hypothetical protein
MVHSIVRGCSGVPRMDCNGLPLPKEHIPAISECVESRDEDEIYS